MGSRNYKLASDFISFAFLLIVYYVYLFNYSFSFNYHLGIATYYPLLVYSFVSISVVSLLSVLGKNHPELNYFDLLMAAALAWFLARNFALTSIHNETVGNTVILIVSYFLSRNLSVFLLKKLFLPAFLLVFLFELYVGCRDIYFNWNNPRLNLFITGTLNNSGVYSIYLAIHLPILHFYLKSILRNNRAGNYVFRLIMLIIVLLAWLAQSRTGLLIIGLYVFLTFSACVFKYKKLIIGGMILLGIAISGWLMYARTGSISGRYLIWKISLLNIYDTLLTGVGYGNFSLVYPRWQIAYFQKLPPSSMAEILHADETYMAFNEPLQFLVETGLLCFIPVFILVMIFLFKKVKSRDNLAPMLRILLAQILLAGFFSYPLHVNAICILFFFALSILSPLVFCQKLNFRVNRLFVCLIGSLAFLGLAQSSIAYQNIYNWEKARDNLFMSEKDKLEAYRILYPSLIHNGKYLLEYGELLYLNEKPGAYKILDESKKYFLSSETLLFSGKAYEAAGEISKAIENYQGLTNLMPYQFGNRKHLVELYLQNHDTLAAVKEVSFILSMPVKRDGSLVKQIKENMHVLRNRLLHK